MMKSLRYLSLVMVLIMIIAGCTPQEIPVEQGRPVKTMVVEETEEPVDLEYFGVVDSKDLKKYSFKVSGKLNRIYQQKGQKVEKGQLLAELDKTDLQFASKAAEYTRVKAESAYKDAADLYDKVQILHTNGASSQRDVDLAKLDRDVKQASLKQAQVDCEHKQSLLKDANLYADIDGYIVDHLNKEGEIIGAGYPVIIVRGSDQIVKLGLTQDDVSKIKIGTKATILGGKNKEKKVSGEVLRIDQVPDRESRTYTVEISIADQQQEEFYLGATSVVLLHVGNAKGIWIPLSAIQNDGQDFVYLVRDNRALRQDVKILDATETLVRIEGLESGTEIVTAGMKNLSDGVLVLKGAETL